MKISGGINFSISSEPCTVEQRLVGSESGPTAKSDKGQEWQYWVPHVRRATVSWAGASGRRGSRSQSHTRDTSSAGWAHHCTGVEGSRGRGIVGVRSGRCEEQRARHGRYCGAALGSGAVMGATFADRSHPGLWRAPRSYNSLRNRLRHRGCGDCASAVNNSQQLGARLSTLWREDWKISEWLRTIQRKILILW